MNAEAKAVLCCTLAVLVAALAGCERKHTTSVEPAGVAWGEPVKGLQAGLEVKEISVEPEPRVPAVHHVRNTGTKPVRILGLPVAATRWLHAPVIVRADGKVLGYKVSHRVTIPPAPREAYIDLAPGETSSGEYTWVPKKWGLGSHLDVDLAFDFHNDSAEHRCAPYDAKTKSWAKVSGLWTGYALSGEVSVGVRRDWRKIAVVAGAATVTLVAAGLAAWCIIRSRRRVKAA